jgi:hypothetical protein
MRFIGKKWGSTGECEVDELVRLLSTVPRRVRPLQANVACATATAAASAAVVLRPTGRAGADEGWSASPPCRVSVPYIRLYPSSETVAHGPECAGLSQASRRREVPMSVLEQVKTAPMSRVQVKAIALCLVMNPVDGFDLLLTSLVGPAIAREWGPDAVAGWHPAQQRAGRHGVRCVVPRPARRPDRPPQAHTRRSRGGLASERSNHRRRGLSVALITTGYGLGSIVAGVATSLLAVRSGTVGLRARRRRDSDPLRGRAAVPARVDGLPDRLASS